MRELILIYISGLLVGTFWPSKVSSRAFISISQSLRFEIDLESPVLAAEEDLLSLQEKKPRENLTAATYLNTSPARKPEAKTTRAFRLVDYSRDLATIHNALNVTLQGPIELRQGLALTDETRIEIHREHKGQTEEYGDVDIENGTYTIKLKSFEGHLCARLRGGTAEILGQGCLALENLKDQKQSSKAGPALSISRYQDLLAMGREVQFARESSSAPATVPTPSRKPLPQKIAGASPEVFDYFQLSEETPVPLADVSVENAVEGNEDQASTLVTSLSAPGYYPVRVVGNATTPNRGVFLPQTKTYRAAQELAKDLGYGPLADAGSSGIWGRVRKDGRSVAGAEVALEGRRDLRPLYLNELYIPDPNQKMTASHGLYTFMGVPEGEYSLRAEHAGQMLGFQNASVREGALSVADIEGTIRRKEVRLSIYDLVSKVSQGAVVTLQNFEEDVVATEGHIDLTVQDTQEAAFAIVNPLNRNYLTGQHSLNPDDELYNFPLIHKDWLENLLAKAKLPQAVKAKVVLGIGAQAPFRVTALGSRQAQILYFDSEGETVEGSTGPSGGGFVVIDPEDHVVEYAIQSAGQKDVRVHYMPTQVGILSLIQMY